jgi:hypothetical protein
VHGGGGRRGVCVGPGPLWGGVWRGGCLCCPGERASSYVELKERKRRGTSTWVFVERYRYESMTSFSGRPVVPCPAVQVVVDSVTAGCTYSRIHSPLPPSCTDSTLSPLHVLCPGVQVLADSIKAAAAFAPYT